MNNISVQVHVTVYLPATVGVNPFFSISTVSPSGYPTTARSCTCSKKRSASPRPSTEKF